MKCCPSCGRPFPPRLKVSGPVRQRVVDIIASRPHGISSADLMALVYAEDPDGGPDCQSIISAIVYHANAQLRDLGYRIVSTLGRGATYSLVKLDADAVIKPAANPDARRLASRAQPTSAARIDRGRSAVVERKPVRHRQGQSA